MITTQTIQDFSSGKLHWIDFYRIIISERSQYVDNSKWNDYLDSLPLDRRKYMLLARSYNYLEMKFPELLINKNVKGSIYAISQVPKLVAHLEKTKTAETEIQNSIQKVLNGELGEHTIREIVNQSKLINLSKNSVNDDILKSFSKMLESLDCLTNVAVSSIGLRSLRTKTGIQCRELAKKLLAVFDESYENFDEETIQL